MARVHDTLQQLSNDLADASPTDAQFLQGPLSDAMTHAGQLAILRRLAGSPVPSENFIHAHVSVDNLSAEQPLPAAPDLWWCPDLPPRPPMPLGSEPPEGS